MDWPDRILSKSKNQCFGIYDFESWLTRKLLYVRVDTMSIRVGRGPEGGPRSSRKQIRSMLDDETGRRDEILVCLHSLVSAVSSRSAYSRENSYCWDRRCRATAVTAHVFHAASRFILKRLLKRREAVLVDEVSPSSPFSSFSPRAWTKGKGYSRETTVVSASMREFVISRDTWQRPFLFRPTSSFSPRVSDRSERLSLARSGSIFFSNEHESISELEEQFPRVDIPDLDHVRDPLPNMHRDMDNLLPRIVVHNMRLQVTEHRLAFERKEEGKRWWVNW